MQCIDETCDSVAVARGYCNTHYAQFMRLGETFPINSRQRPKGATLERNERGEKYCTRCDAWRPEVDFGYYKKSADLLRADCKTCRRIYAQSRADVRRAYNRLKKFGLTPEAFDALFRQQAKRCAICRSESPGPRDWHVDHNHACCPDPRATCGRCVRGVLCHSCNTLLGLAEDDPARLRAAALYVEFGAL
jgi:hypothetical protein